MRLCFISGVYPSIDLTSRPPQPLPKGTKAYWPEWLAMVRSHGSFHEFLWIPRYLTYLTTKNASKYSEVSKTMLYKNFVQVFPKAMIGPDVDEGGRNSPWEAIAFQDYELVRLVCITLVQPKYNDKGGEKLRNPPRASGRKNRKKNTRQFAGFLFNESINQSYIIDVLSIIWGWFPSNNNDIFTHSQSLVYGTCMVLHSPLRRIAPDRKYEYLRSI